LEKYSFPVIGLAGWSGAGKSTFGIRLTRELKKRGLRVAIVKHTTHRNVVTDTPESDTWRYAQAGGDIVLLSTPQQIVSWERLDTELSLADVLARVRDVDLVIVEGYKSAQIPKIEIWRQEGGGALISADDQLIALVTDGAPVTQAPTFALDDVIGVADLLASRYALKASHSHYDSNPTR
jgi:molybdopterin-guanine dinucleotide biosynthesis protein B